MSTSYFSISKIAALILTLVFMVGVCFQILLALGFPLGRMAWRGMYEVLPSELRIASLFSSLIFVIATIFVLEKAGIISIINRSKLTTYVVWFLFVLFGISSLANIFSPSELEKLIMTPLAFISSILCFIVAKTKNSK